MSTPTIGPSASAPPTRGFRGSQRTPVSAQRENSAACGVHSTRGSLGRQIVERKLSADAYSMPHLVNPNLASSSSAGSFHALHSSSSSNLPALQEMPQDLLPLSQHQLPQPPGGIVRFYTTTPTPTGTVGNLNTIHMNDGREVQQRLLLTVDRDSVSRKSSLSSSPRRSRSSLLPMYQPDVIGELPASRRVSADCGPNNSAGITQPHIHGPLRRAIPVMNIGWASFCACMNFLVPGSGTLISAAHCLTGNETEHESKYASCALNIVCAVLQLILAPIIIGWIWSCVWGVIFVNLARKWWVPRLEDRDNTFERLSFKI